MNYYSFSRELEEHHAIFYHFWKMGRPVFTEDIPTACIQFDRSGEEISFLFNQAYWDSLDDYGRKFVICHEFLHIILRHGIRIKNTQNPQACNACLDVVVNHMLVRSFGFKRELLKFGHDLCWVDTVFPDKQVSDEENFEYYYGLLPRVDVKLVDDHSFLGNAEGGDEVIRRLAEGMADPEKETLKDILNNHTEITSEEQTRGTTPGTIWKLANVGVVKKKKKWETIIKKWSKKYKKAEKTVDQWARLNRRFTFLPRDLLIPSEMEYEKNDEGKIEVWFFQDTSGSCYHFRDRFFTAAKSLDPKRFDMRLYCFDTRVYETSLSSGRLYGFGGTYFSILEKYIVDEIKKNGKKYPEAVFVITDGYGDRVQMAQPKKWYWFLSTTYTNCIPKECNIFNLRDFE